MCNFNTKQAMVLKRVLSLEVCQHRFVLYLNEDSNSNRLFHALSTMKLLTFRLALFTSGCKLMS